MRPDGAAVRRGDEADKAGGGSDLGRDRVHVDDEVGFPARCAQQLLHGGPVARNSSNTCLGCMTWSAPAAPAVPSGQRAQHVAGRAGTGA
ncbi:hypothetical protein [Massilia phosphatilytica]